MSTNRGDIRVVPGKNDTWRVRRLSASAMGGALFGGVMGAALGPAGAVAGMVIGGLTGEVVERHQKDAASRTESESPA